MSLLPAAPAAADATLQIDGVWGNEAGCKYARDGQVDDDTFVVLKADGLDSYGTGCEWVQVFRARGGEQVAIGLCGYEGEGGLGSETFIVSKDLSDPGKMVISTGPGEPWGVVERCP